MSDENKLANVAVLLQFVEQEPGDFEPRHLRQRDALDIRDDPKRAWRRVRAE